MIETVASNVVELGNQAEPFELVQQEPELFEYLVFHRDGTVSIQTNKSKYFFCTALFSCALDLNRMLRGRATTNLEYGIEANRILDPKAKPEYLCVDRDKVMEGIYADKVTSNWPRVVEFFDILRALYIETELNR